MPELPNSESEDMQPTRVPTGVYRGSKPTTADIPVRANLTDDNLWCGDQDQ